MPDPFSTLVLMTAANQVDDWIGGPFKKFAGGVAVDVVGNIADRLLGRFGKNAIMRLGLAGRDDRANHDVMRALRHSMITATQLAREAMKDAGEEKRFRKALDKWTDKEMAQLDDVHKWHDWQNPAIHELELFFDGGKELAEKRADLLARMNDEWLIYLRHQIHPLGLPEAFTNKIETGWDYKGTHLQWAEIVIAEFKAYLRYNDDDKKKLAKAQNSEKAFVHNFLADIKLVVDDLPKALKKILQPELDGIKELVKNLHPRMAEEVEARWLDIVQWHERTIDELRAEITEINASKKAVEELLFKAVIEGAFDKGQTELLRQQRDDLEKKYEEILTENAVLKAEAVMAREDEIQRLLTEGKTDDLLAAAAQAMADGRFSVARQMRIQSAMQKEALSKAQIKEAAYEYYQLAKDDQSNSRYADSVVYFQKAIELEPNNSTYRNALGILLGDMGFNHESIKQLESANNLINGLGKQDQFFFENSMQLAVRYTETKQYRKSIELYLDLLVFTSKYYGSPSKEAMLVRIEIGDAYRLNTQYEQALLYSTEALKIASLLRDDYWLARPHKQLGYIFMSLNRIDEAINHFNQGLTIIRKCAGVDKGLVSEYTAALAFALHDKGLHENARTLIQTSEPLPNLDYNNLLAEAREKIKLAADSENIDRRDLIDLYFDEATWSSIVGNKDDALRSLQKALLMCEGVYEPNNRKISVILHTMALRFCEKEMYEEAIRMDERALKIDRSRLGYSHSEVAIRYFHLGEDWSKFGDYGKSRRYFKLALKIDLETYGDNFSYVARDKIQIGLSYKMERKFEEAIFYLNSAEKFYSQVIGFMKFVHADIYQYLSEIYLEIKNYPMALTCSWRGFQIAQEIWGDEHQNTKEKFNLWVRAMNSIQPLIKNFMENRNR